MSAATVYGASASSSLDAKGGFVFTEGDAVHMRILPPAPRRRHLSKRAPRPNELLAALGATARPHAPLAALFIDYGHAETGSGDTLQAVAAHDYADPLASPGDGRSLRPCRLRRAQA